MDITIYNCCYEERQYLDIHLLSKEYFNYFNKTQYRIERSANQDTINFSIAFKPLKLGYSFLTGMLNFSTDSSVDVHWLLHKMFYVKEKD